MNINDKVVCIDDNWATSHDNPHKWFNAVPVKGQTYVVRGFVVCKDGQTAVQLVGMRTFPEDNGGFRMSRFASLAELKGSARKAVAA